MKKDIASARYKTLKRIETFMRKSDTRRQETSKTSFPGISSWTVPWPRVMSLELTKFTENKYMLWKEKPPGISRNQWWSIIWSCLKISWKTTKILLSALKLCLSIKFLSSQQLADILNSRLLKSFRNGKNHNYPNASKMAWQSTPSVASRWKMHFSMDSLYHYVPIC